MAVIDTMRMHLKPDKALLYLKDEHKIKMADQPYTRWKQIINTQVNQRLYHIAQYDFPKQHVEAIEEIRTARKMIVG